MSEKKSVMVLGVGLQGRAVIQDLEKAPVVGQIVAADLEIQGAKEYVDRAGLRKVHLVTLDVTNQKELKERIRSSGADVIICMLPATFGYSIARAAIDEGVAFVSSSYTGKISELDGDAREKGVTILPEMGMDPGIDLFLAKLVIAELDEVHGLYSYGAGLPEPTCADNPLKYKITWSFEGVLQAYERPARLLKDGVEASIAGDRIFDEENVHLVDVDGLGQLEAYPKGDAIHYIDVFGLGAIVKTMARFAMRYPGHCNFWKALVGLGFLDNTPIDMDGGTVSPHEFLVRHLTPRLQYTPQERDVAVVRVHGWGLKDGKRHGIIYQLTDYRDLKSGLFAMNRTVGYTTSIGAQMILDGRINKAGVLTPVCDVDGKEVLDALESKGMQLKRMVTEG